MILVREEPSYMAKVFVNIFWVWVLFLGAWACGEELDPPSTFWIHCVLEIGRRPLEPLRNSRLWCSVACYGDRQSWWCLCLLGKMLGLGGLPGPSGGSPCGDTDFIQVTEVYGSEDRWGMVMVCLVHQLVKVIVTAECLHWAVLRHTELVTMVSHSS